ncbi:MAG TPA: anthranilate synthase component I family protein [Actinomycetota bacterium]|nr:anthranilate synthase component I family protein [Actinomycetota bacterium]
MELRVRPSEEEFASLGRGHALAPVWAELLGDVSTPVGVFPALAGDGPGALLESVERSERWGRYSFVAGDPAAVVTADWDGVRVESVARELPLPWTSQAGPVLPALKELAASLGAPHPAELPPVTGGLVGCIAYEAAELLDGHPHPAGDAGCPPMRYLVVDRAVVFDHWRQRMILVAHVPPGAYGAGVDALHALAERVALGSGLAPEPVGAAGGDGGTTPAASVGEEEFRSSVGRAREHILAGDIFQVVLSRRLSVPCADGGLAVYRRLRVTNPSPYMFFLRMPDGLELAGSSPEPLVRVERRRVTTRPIAGTRRRGATADEDAALEHELLADPKERAEHAMLVDLARNDLGRVCTAGSVRPTELMEVERFSRVMHIVSTVEGDLREGLTPLDALAATFPAGTVTGAPKRRAMEIIAEEEPTARGPYAGAVGYLTFAGDLDVCITIRTAILQGGMAHVQAGAGIVYDSDPERELRETEAKASALMPAVGAVPAGEAGPPAVVEEVTVA